MHTMVSAHFWSHACEGLKLILGLSIILPPSSLRGGLSVKPRICQYVLYNESFDSRDLVSWISENGIPCRLPCSDNIYMVSRDPSSGPLACMVNILAAEPVPHT